MQNRRLSKLQSWPIWTAAAVACVVFAVIRWGVAAGAAVPSFVAGLVVVTRFTQPKATESRELWLTLTLLALAPLEIGLLMFAVIPTFFRPLFTIPVGGWMLAAILILLGASFSIVQVGVRQLIRKRMALGIVLVIVSFGLSGIALFLVLFGPPIAILSLPSPYA